MHIKYKSPMARRAALAYCRRCLAMMLCCVLVFCLTVRTAPRAQASTAVAATIATAGAAGSTVTVGSALCTVILTACGVDFMNGVYNQGDGAAIVSARAYQVGYELEQYLEGLVGQSDVVYQWWVDLLTDQQAKGGLAPGDSITIPPEVAAAVKSWAAGNIDFVSDSAVYTDRGFFSANSQVIFTPFPSGYAFNKVPPSVVSMGSMVPVGGSFSFSFSDVEGRAWELKCYSDGGFSHYEVFKNGESLGATYCGSNSLFFHLRELNGKCYLCVGILDSNTGLLQFTGEYWKNESELVARYPCIDVASVTALTTTLNRTPPLYAVQKEQLVVTIPSALPVVDIGGYTVPVIVDMTATDVLDHGEDDPLDPPAEGALPWDKIKDWLEQWGQENRDLINGYADRIPEAVDNAVGQAVPGAVTQAVNDALPSALDNALADALPITGTIAGDQVMEEVAQNPEGLGAVIVSKFPFSIPWDIARTVQLLAAPPVTPRFEFDFLGPMADLVGGFPGDTTIVVDFSEYEIVGQVTRWFSTVMFVYWLAVLTKTYIWTA